MIPSEVVDAVLSPHQVRVKSELGGGLSGARVFLCEGARTLVLRRWPTTTRLQRVLEIQSVVQSVSHRFPLFPRYQGIGVDGRQFHWVDGQDQIWELTEWKPGNPLTYDASQGGIRSGIRAIAAMHLHLRSLRIDPDRIVANEAGRDSVQSGFLNPGGPGYGSGSSGFLNPGGPSYGNGSSGFLNPGGPGYGSGSSGFLNPGGPSYGSGSSGFLNPGGPSYGSGSPGFLNPGGPSYGSGGFGSQVCPAVLQRIDRLEWLDKHLASSVAALRPSSLPANLSQIVTDAGQLLIQRWPSASARMRRQLMAFRSRPVSVHPVVRDIHREHVLFRGDEPTGIIDFDALRIDSPAVDLARWLGSFQIFCQDPAKTIDWGVADYRSEQALQAQEGLPGGTKVSRHAVHVVDAYSPQFPTLVRAIAESSAWISLANWVVWLAEAPNRFADSGAVARRLLHLTPAVMSIDRD